MLAALLLLALQPPPAATPDPPDFAQQVQPILRRACWKCHGADKQKGDVRLDLRSAAFGPDRDLWTILPGEPDDSLLLEVLLLPDDDPDRMPKKQPPLPATDIDVIRRWIAAGADWPESADTAVLAALAAKRQPRLELDAVARTTRDVALVKLRGHRVPASRIAADTDAVEVNFSLRGDDIDDARVADLAGLGPCLVRLSLARTSVSDRGLAVLRGMRELRRLDLSQTAISDAGLAHLADLAELRYLNLFGTKVTDAGLTQLAELKNLRKLFVWQTGVTAAAVAKLHKTRPELEVDHGGHAAAIAAVRDRLTQASETAAVTPPCPITGKPADPKIFVAKADGTEVAFCCEKCRAKFLADQQAAAEAKKKVEATPSDAGK